MSTPDQATRDAVSALAARIRRRDQVEPVAARVTAEQLAAQFISDLRGQGWRPTPARPAVDWHVTERPAPPEQQHQRAEEIREALRRHPHN